MRISQRLFIRLWTRIYDYITCFMRSMSILVCRSMTSGVIGITTGVWRHVAHSRVNLLCGSEGEWCTQRICGSTCWWRAPKRLFSAGWSHMPHLEWEHDRTRKLSLRSDYFESLMAAKISWLKSARFFPVGRLKRKNLCHQPRTIQELQTTFDVKLLRLVRTSCRPLSQTWSVTFSSAWTVVANISSISCSIDKLFMKQGM